MNENPQLVSEWDKTVPQSDAVDHRKVTFHNRYVVTLVADPYTPKGADGKLPAIAGASHTDLYDRSEIIPFDRIAEFFAAHL